MVVEPCLLLPQDFLPLEFLEVQQQLHFSLGLVLYLQGVLLHSFNQQGQLELLLRLQKPQLLLELVPLEFTLQLKRLKLKWKKMTEKRQQEFGSQEHGLLYEFD